jgi:hypothetical protein
MLALDEFRSDERFNSVSNLRDAARGQQCQIRIGGICSFNPEETVLAHFRMAGICGTGLKPIDLIGSWACARCHDAVDGRVSTGYTHDQLRLMHLEGMARTLDALVKQGKLSNGRGEKR